MNSVYMIQTCKKNVIYSNYFSFVIYWNNFSMKKREAGSSQNRESGLGRLQRGSDV